MMKRYVKYSLTILLSVSLFFFLFVLKTNKIAFSAIALLVYFIAMNFIVRYRRPIPQRKSDELFVVVGFSILFLGLTFLFGFLFGTRSEIAVVLQRFSSFSKWLVIAFIAIITEMIRYYMHLGYDKNKKYEFVYYLLMFITFVLIDLVISPKVYTFSGIEAIYEFIGVFVIQSISKNILLNYLSGRFGFVPCLFYRFLIDLFPFEPKVNVLIYSVLLFILPFIIYFVIKSLYEKKKNKKGRKVQTKTREKVYTTILTVFLVILVSLVSCEFRYGMIAIGSSSMTGSINKGDAVIYEKYDKNSDKLEEGDVIIYKKSDIMIVHRIYKKTTENGLNVYKTKGDNNDAVDSWDVDDSEIVGVVRARVLFIAWPSVWLGELFD